jgi:hypothetical protein
MMVMLIPTTGVKVKVALSSLVLAPHLSSANSALVPLDNALRLEEVVVLALLILDPITASGFTLLKAMIATMLMLILMLDSPVSKPLEDLPDLNASREPLTLRVPALKPLSASSIPAVEAVATLS